MSSLLKSRTIVLKSSDGVTFEIEEDVAQLSVTIKQMMDEDRSKTVFPLSNVKGSTLLKVIDYCKKHVTDKEADEESLKLFDSEFIKDVEGVSLSYLIDAAKILEITSLYDLCYEALVASSNARRLDEILEMTRKLRLEYLD